MANWFTGAQLDRAHAAIPELPIENEELAGMLLDVARERVLEFAADDEPAVQVATLLENLGVEEAVITAVITLLDFEATEPGVPARYVWAQAQDVKNLWLAGRSEDGPEGFTYAARPLSKDIQKIIRPTSGVPSVF